jgi:hypothetical protein
MFAKTTLETISIQRARYFVRNKQPELALTLLQQLPNPDTGCGECCHDLRFLIITISENNKIIAFYYKICYNVCL